jgi:hypothetical protein
MEVRNTQQLLSVVRCQESADAAHGNRASIACGAKRTLQAIPLDRCLHGVASKPEP